MKDIRHAENGSREGIALIIVLGLLAVLTLLAIAFAIAMRVERLAARNYANGVRASTLVQTCLTRATAEISKGLVGRVYPAQDVSVSVGSAIKCTNLLDDAEAVNSIPKSLLAKAQTESDKCYWQDVKVTGVTKPIGRVAYIALNCSGLLDANVVGGEAFTYSNTAFRTRSSQIPLTGLPDFDSPSDATVPGGAFFANRTLHKRYETLPELAALNKGVIESVSNLFTYSYDVDRDQYFTKTDHLGTPEAEALNELITKFNINNITNYACWNDNPDPNKYRDDPAFTSTYLPKLERALLDVGCSPGKMDDTKWNIINYLDRDRLPQGKKHDAWAHSEAGESMPLINEITFYKSVSGGTTTQGHFKVELWYPFAPVPAKPEDFVFQWAIWTNNFDPPSGVSQSRSGNNPYPNESWECQPAKWPPFETKDTDLTNLTHPAYKFGEQPIGEMSFYGPNQFKEFLTDEVAFKGNCLWFICRVAYRGKIGGEIHPVDQAGGIGSTAGKPEATWVYLPIPYKLNLIAGSSGQMSWSVSDPRSNGRCAYWSPQTETAGAMNANCTPWGLSTDVDTKRKHGLPIFAKNGTMVNIGELGHIFFVEGAANWQNIELMKAGMGGRMMDEFTVRETNWIHHIQGLVSVNTSQKDVLRCLFEDMQIGFTEEVTGTPHLYKLLPPDITAIVDAIQANRTYICFSNMFERVDLRNACRTAAYNAVQAGPHNPALDISPASYGNPARVCDIYEEDAFRRIVEIITFRQNIFTILLAAQVIGADGTGVLAEKRAVAVLYRDAYTGGTFIRSFKWLSDKS